MTTDFINDNNDNGTINEEKEATTDHSFNNVVNNAAVGAQVEH